jgi:two-component system nitrogen regulation sensor histidine kinase NtrY
VDTTATSLNRSLRKFRLWSRHRGLSRKLAVFLAVAAVLSGIATVVILTGAASPSPDPKTVLILLYLDTVLLLGLGVVVARRLTKVWTERKQGLAGSRLHIRFVVMFSLVAVTPAILVAVFSALFLNFGIQSWFSERVRTALDESEAVASAYLYEHKQSIRSDALAAANDLNNSALMLSRNPQIFSNMLSTQAGLRNLPEAVVVDSHGNVLAQSRFSQLLSFEQMPPGIMQKAASGEIIVITNKQDDRVRAVVKLGAFVDAYLLVGRFVDPKALGHLERTKGAVAEYRQLAKRQTGIQISFVVIFAVVALLLLLAAVWVGLNMATRLVRPLSNLIAAAEKVSGGDLGVRVDATAAADEIGALSRGFNRMTSQLESQHQGLMDANRQLDERRRFTETVLAGVSAGVIGLDREGRINLPNRSASELLAADLEKSIGGNLAEIVPEMRTILAAIKNQPGKMRQAEIRVMRDGRYLTLLVRVAAERVGADIIGFVVTFDDITELQSAQRKAAWADVARRIAHEIKNPLTPIQLSAERLKRKYLSEIKTDPEIFSTCTDTIVRQVSDIGRMVDEFSSFARMPRADLSLENISELCRQVVFLERNRHPTIEYDLSIPEGKVMVHCDGRQISQALTNILKNAAESVSGRLEESGGRAGLIKTVLEDRQTDGERLIAITVEDNGKGLPRKDRGRLTEPYVTTRTEGSGLGLAIVKKIMEDHNGNLILENIDGGDDDDKSGGGSGARVKLVFNPNEEAAGEAAKKIIKAATGIPALGS